MTYQYHDCDERGCAYDVRSSHQRTQERHRRSVMGKIIRAGRPAPSIRALPTTSPLGPRGFETTAGWVDETHGLRTILGFDPARPTGIPVVGQVASDNTIRLVGERQPKPFDFRAYTQRFGAQFPEHDRVNQMIREATDEWNRDMLAKWEEMLANLPEPPEGMAWHPVVETESEVDLDRLRNEIRYSIRAVLREAPQSGAGERVEEPAPEEPTE